MLFSLLIKYITVFLIFLTRYLGSREKWNQKLGVSAGIRQFRTVGIFCEKMIYQKIGHSPRFRHFCTVQTLSIGTFKIIIWYFSKGNESNTIISNLSLRIIDLKDLFKSYRYKLPVGARDPLTYFFLVYLLNKREKKL